MRTEGETLPVSAAIAQETENFVSAVTSGATAIQDLSRRLNFVTTVTIEENIGKDCDPRSQSQIDFVSAVTSGATAIQDLSQGLYLRSQSRNTTCDHYYNLRKLQKNRIQNYS